MSYDQRETKIGTRQNAIRFGKATYRVERMPYRARFAAEASAAQSGEVVLEQSPGQR